MTEPVPDSRGSSQPDTAAREPTFWNGEPCEARKVTGVVVDDGRFPQYWARLFVGTERRATEVTYGGNTFYLDDEDWQGSGDEPGWRKVTAGRGSPQYMHRSLQLEGVTPRG